MNKRKILGILAIIMILNILISNFSYASSTIGNEYTVKYEKNDYRYIAYNDISQRFFNYYYVDDANNKMDAYCINLGQNGAETVEGGYKVQATGYITDKNLINIINNGYPYKDYEELGLKNENQAKFATQFALWIYTNNLDISKIKELDNESVIVKDAIINIYNSRNNEVFLDTNIEIKEVEHQIVEINKKDFYKVKVSIVTGKDIIELKYQNNIKDIKFVDNNLRNIESLNGNEEIYLLYPVESVEKDTIFELKFSYKSKSNNALYGKPNDSSMQNVALILPKYDEKEVSVPIKFEYKKLQLKINKKDIYNKPLGGVKFNIYELNTDKFLGEYVTDKNGSIFIDFRKDLNINNDIEIKIQEIETLEEYLLLENTINTKLEYEKCISVDIINRKKEKKNDLKIDEKVELPKTGM